MKQCKDCQVMIEDNSVKCPLCFKSVVEKRSTSDCTFYPVGHRPEAMAAGRLFPNINLFVSVLIISTCLLINILTTPNHLWFIYVIAPVLYLLLLFNHTLLSKSHVGSKIILQVLGLSSLLFFLDYNTSFERWSVNIVHPFLVIGATLLITVIIIVQRMRWRDYVGYITTMILLGFMPLALYLTGISSSLWASAGAALYALLTLIGMFLFSDQSFKNDLKRRFHF
ncbi:DUF6320 domain-containing protein [Salibacterium aidingense]|uniref:DUF6320 domain-containing protein n=1 Tax=Salibacterium aidingense TaxID=384933 RepID=UPI003BCD9A6F